MTKPPLHGLRRQRVWNYGSNGFRRIRYDNFDSLRNTIAGFAWQDIRDRLEYIATLQELLDLTERLTQAVLKFHKPGGYEKNYEQTNADCEQLMIEIVDEFKANKNVPNVRSYYYARDEDVRHRRRHRHGSRSSLRRDRHHHPHL